MTPPPHFRSAVDAALTGVLTAGMLVTAAGAAAMLTAGFGLWSLVCGGVVLAAAACILWTLLDTRYTFEADRLRVRSGLFCWTVPVGDIVASQPSRSLASGPALAMDRLALSLKDGRTLLVSPRDKDGFLAELEARRAAEAV